MFWAVMAAAALYVVRAYPALPDPLASTFGAGGRPTGWMSRRAFVTIFGAVYLFTSAAVGLLPLRRMRGAGLNLPHREYWLSPERIEHTLLSVQTQLTWIGTATQVLMLTVFRMTETANRLDPPRLEMAGFWIVFLGYMIFIVAWTIHLLRRFSRVPHA